MIRLSKEQVVLLHERLIEITGGSNGIRDVGIFNIKWLWAFIYTKRTKRYNPWFSSWQNRCRGYVAMDYKSWKVMYEVIMYS